MPENLGRTRFVRRGLETSWRGARYIEARARLQLSLAPDDARYTEVRLAELAAADFEPSEDFLALEDYEPFESEARALRERIERNLVTGRLAELRRSSFYSLVAAEGSVRDLDRRPAVFGSHERAGLARDAESRSVDAASGC